MTRDLLSRDLVVNHRVDEYDGTTAVVRNAHLSADDIEFMRWKAERWMKVRHLPSEIRHAPRFVLRHGAQMLAHTFRGSTWRSFVGLEGARDVFRRYRAIRAREREYVDWPDPYPPASLVIAAVDDDRAGFTANQSYPLPLRQQASAHASAHASAP
jgi:hypothetical protein